MEILEVKGWTFLKAAFIIDVASLDDLKRVAEGYGAPFIVQKGKEYVCFVGHTMSFPLCYRFKR